MKLLYVKTSGFKNLHDDCVLDFIAKSKKTTEDKEYELQEIDEGLFVYNTAAIIGKNASGKTTAMELIDCCYSILSDFSLEDKNYSYDGIYLELYFYHEGRIYKYITNLNASTTLSTKATFSNQKIFSKKYFKTNLKTIFEDAGYTPLSNIWPLPEDTSSVLCFEKKANTGNLF